MATDAVVDSSVIVALGGGQHLKNTRNGHQKPCKSLLPFSLDFFLSPFS
jgi:hypothetical protein